MTEIACYLHGAHPRSEELVAATRDADRGRQTPADVQARRNADRAEFLDLQAAAGLDYRSVGWLSWPDLFRPLIEACAGLTAGPLTRWFDTNTFVRAPVIDGPLELDPAAFASAAGATGSDVALLPGPYTFSRLVEPRTDPDALIEPLAASLLRPAAEQLRAAGATLLHLQEPALVAGSPGPTASSLADLDRALRILRDGLDLRVVLHTYYGDAGPLLPTLRQLPLDAVGVDLTRTDLESLRGPWPIGLLAGCLDGRSSLVESVDATAGVARRVVELAQPPWLLLSSGGDLELLPRTVADAKVGVLGAATRRLREAL